MWQKSLALWVCLKKMIRIYNFATAVVYVSKLTARQTISLTRILIV